MKRGLLAFLAVLALGLGMTASPATAATQVIVTPSNPQGWCWTQPCADTRPGGAVNFVADPTAPGDPHRGALQLTTDLTITAKAQAVHSTNTPLASVTELSYWTKQVSGTPLVADPAYQLAICANGLTATGCAPNRDAFPVSSFTTLVFEPYQNPTQGPIVANAWQQWDVAAGLFWSTRTIRCSNGVLVGTPGGPATYTLAQVKVLCPEALVVQFIANVGTNNPGYNVYTDLFNFNGTIYNFEPDATCREKDNNKDGNKEKDNNKDGNKLPKCDDDDSGDNEDSD